MTNSTMFNPFMAMTPPTPSMFMPTAEGFFERMAAAPRMMEVAKRVKVGATPHDVIYTEDKLRVFHYHSDTPKKYATPLVLCFALVNRPYILDLLPHKSVVQQFLKAGFDVYLIDWGTPEQNDQHLTIEHYVCRYMHNVMTHVAEFSGQEQVSLLGYCMGGTFSAMYTSLHQEMVKNLMLMAAPVDWSDREALLIRWTDPKYYDVDGIIDAYGNAPTHVLQGAFALLKPVANLMEKYIGFYERMNDEKFIEEFTAMETWVNDNIPVAGETFRQFVKDCFQKNLLPQGKMKLKAKRIDLSNITCPVLNLMASNDHLVTCGQSAPFNDLVSSKDRRAITFRAGHIGLSVSSRAHKELWPTVCDWLGERSEKL
ncbi:MAG TPA: class III poly(R)-hydroxyalkanoic acid synthase subunit PhaC [Phycisphaerae bacterium]|nr:class III poly(R)-hydroxyalkanoic acid synthase subunit PhaC [Phycisphaerae bacterium]